MSSNFGRVIHLTPSAADAGALPLSGGTLTGDLKLGNTCRIALNGTSDFTSIAPGRVVVSDKGEGTTFLKQDGLGITNLLATDISMLTLDWENDQIKMEGNKLADVGAPVKDSDAATKGYVDAAVRQNAGSSTGGVPVTRKINGKPLSTDISLTAADVGAIPATGMDLEDYLAFNQTSFSAGIQVGDQRGGLTTIASNFVDTPRVSGLDSPTADTDAANKGYVDKAVSDIVVSQTGGVPATRKINGKPLSTDISLTASDVGAAAANHSHSGYASSSHTHTPSSIGAAAANHSHSGYASSGHTHTAADVGAIPKTGMDLDDALRFTQRGSGGFIEVYSTDNGTPRSTTISSLGVGTKRVYGLDAPSSDTDAVNKAYVDAAVRQNAGSSTGGVPVTRKVNGKALSTDISLTASDVGAATAGHTHSAADVGAIPKTGMDLDDTLRFTQTGSSGFIEVYSKNGGTTNSTTVSSLGVGTKRVYGLDAPSSDTDAANKTYVDTKAAAALPKSGGTMTGDLLAKSDADYATAKVRNAYFTTSDLTAGSSSLASGVIAIVYE